VAWNAWGLFAKIVMSAATRRRRQMLQARVARLLARPKLTAHTFLNIRTLNQFNKHNCTPNTTPTTKTFRAPLLPSPALPSPPPRHQQHANAQSAAGASLETTPILPTLSILFRHLSSSPIMDALIQGYTRTMDAFVGLSEGVVASHFHHRILKLARR